jgi:hypothetical protein
MKNNNNNISSCRVHFNAREAQLSQIPNTTLSRADLEATGAIFDKGNVSLLIN